MRAITFIIFLLFVLIYLFSCDKTDITIKQSESFIKFYGGPGLDYGVDVKQTDDGGYAILGTTSTPDNGTDMCLILTDKYGNSITDTKYFGGRSDDVGKCMNILDDQGLILVGSYQDTITGYFDIFLVRINNNGETIWTKKIGDQGNQEAFDIQINNSGDFVIVGYNESHLTSSATNTKKDIFQIILNPDGEIIWQPNPIPLNEDDIGQSLQIENNGYVITGNTKSRPVGTTKFHSFVIKTNLLGSISSELKYLFETEMDFLNHIEILADNNYLVSGTLLIDNIPYIYLTKINSRNLEIIWKISFDDLPNAYGTGLEIINNEIVIFGTHRISGSSSSIVMIRTDLDRKFLYLNEYGISGQMESSGFDITEDIGYIFTGSNKTDDNSVITLIKTKYNGEF